MILASEHAGRSHAWKRWTWPCAHGLSGCQLRQRSAIILPDYAGDRRRRAGLGSGECVCVHMRVRAGLDDARPTTTRAATAREAAAKGGLRSRGHTRPADTRFCSLSSANSSTLSGPGRGAWASSALTLVDTVYMNRRCRPDWIGWC